MFDNVCGGGVGILSQIWAWRNLHGVEPWSDFLSEFGDLFRSVCQRRGARGQQRLLLWKMQGEGLYTATHAFIMLHVKPFILEACISVSSEQRTTVKRTCIKSLPSVLCIHLMRFGFDWESGRSIKYDEQIRVCWKIYILKLYSSMLWGIFFHFIVALQIFDMNLNILLNSSPGFWTWSPTRCLEWPVRTAAGRWVREEEMEPREDHPERKLPFQRTMNWWGSWSTVVRHMLDTTTPSSKTDGKRIRCPVVFFKFIGIILWK